jgi:hypothetical protein
MPESVSKPVWTLDIKIISNAIDRMSLVNEDSHNLDIGHGASLVSLKSNLELVYDALGGNLDSEGNMLDPKARSDIEIYFKRLEEWERSVIPKLSTDGKVEDINALLQLKIILRLIRITLQTEINRLFVKFTKSLTPRDVAQIQALGETYVPTD